MVIRTDLRKLFKAGNSIVLSIPPDFLKINDLERGNHMEVSWLGSLLQVTPVISSEKGKKLNKRRRNQLKDSNSDGNFLEKSGLDIYTKSSVEESDSKPGISSCPDGFCESCWESGIRKMSVRKVPQHGRDVALCQSCLEAAGWD